MMGPLPNTLLSNDRGKHPVAILSEDEYEAAKKEYGVCDNCGGLRHNCYLTSDGRWKRILAKTWRWWKKPRRGWIVVLDNKEYAKMLQRHQEYTRRKRGECISCGFQCYHLKTTLFSISMTPISLSGLVLNGRCLACKPLDDKIGIPKGDA